MTAVTSQEDREARPAPAFEEFVVVRGPALLRLARGLLRDPDAAEDVVQDVLGRALLRWDRIGATEDPRAYVNRMVVNACTSWWRLAARRERPARGDLPDVPDAARRPEDVLADRDLLLRELRRLPPKQRAALVLRHFEGMGDEEIAAVLQVSEVTVRSNVSRGLAALRRALGGT